MADNTLQNGTDTIATDDLTTLNGGAVSGFKVQRTKVGFGVDGSLRDVDSTNGLPVVSGQSGNSVASWTSATSVNTALSVTVTNFSVVSIAISTTTTMTAGAVTFEVSPDGTVWFPVSAARIDSFTVESVYTLTASTLRAWTTSVDGFTFFRVRLSTAITGTGTASVFVSQASMAIEPIVTVGQATASNLLTTATTSSASTSTLASVTAATSSTTIRAANTARRMLAVFNDSTAILYLAFAATASTTAYTVQLQAGDYYEMPEPVYNGLVTGIWSAANGAARVTEVT